MVLNKIFKKQNIKHKIHGIFFIFLVLNKIIFFIVTTNVWDLKLKKKKMLQKNLNLTKNKKTNFGIQQNFYKKIYLKENKKKPLNLNKIKTF